MSDNPIVPGPWLARINTPADLRTLHQEDLEHVARDLRQFIVEHCARFGGHFGASMGVVELTVALHYIYNTPHDQLIWDVGHQAYGHKLLTGRRDRFHTNRKYKGVSGFPKRSESEYDTFGVGHSSTSISAAAGMAMAARQKGEDRKIIAVIGDGAMTGGMAFEGLNHAGHLDADMLVVLNDNCMSIDQNVGALMEYLTSITTSRTYNKVRNEVWKVLGKFEKVLGVDARHMAAKLEDVMTQGVLRPGFLFESLGFRYFGPIDGHDVFQLANILKDLKEIPGPKLLHIVTVKGKGFEPAEKDQTFWHAPAFNFDTLTGADLTPPKTGPSAPKAPKYQDVFGETLMEMCRLDDRIVGVTPAMLSGSGMVEFSRQFPDRCFDVGIAEQHAVTFSAGLATQGRIPFCNIYSTFMQRAYDQVIHDVAIQDLKVIFCLDRAGVVGADGATHHGCYDLSYFRAIPNLVISAPMNEQELRNLMYTAAQDSQTHPFVIRYPRGSGVMPDWRTPLQAVEVGTGRLVTDGDEVAILSIGHPGNFAQQAIQTLAAQGLRPAHYDLRFVKPLDAALLHQVFARFGKIVTVEDGSLPGGFGSAILEFMAEHGYTASVKRLGIPDRVVHQGTQEELWRECGYDAQAIAEAVVQLAGVPAVSV